MKILVTSTHHDSTDQSSHALLCAKLDAYGNDFPSGTFRVLKEKEIHLYGEYRTKRLILEAWGQMKHVIGTGEPGQIPLDSPPRMDTPPTTQAPNCPPTSTPLRRCQGTMPTRTALVDTSAFRALSRDSLSAAKEEGWHLTTSPWCFFEKAPGSDLHF